MTKPPQSIDDTLALLQASGYVAGRDLATVVFLALKMGRPLFLEGEAGVGKTEIANVLAEGLGRKLIRLQCYEGLDINSAVYEWNYAAQMIEIRLAEASGELDRSRMGQDIFAEKFLIKRALLQALEPTGGQAPAFEAYLLEILSDFQITIPELGTIKAAEPPIVIITSNRTREVHDALKRRCLYHWVGYPTAARELEIVKLKRPDASAALAREVVSFVQALRQGDLFKSPGVAETLDWVSALHELDAVTLDPQTVNDTLGVLLKYQDDIVRMEGSEAKRILSQIKDEIRALARG
jgi:MoxR-like ATPase